MAITGTGRDVDVAALGKALLGDLLSARLERFEDALAPLEEDLDAGDAEALASAQGLRADYETQLEFMEQQDEDLNALRNEFDLSDPLGTSMTNLENALEILGLVIDGPLTAQLAQHTHLVR